MAEKEIKEEFRKKTGKNPDEYYATSVLKEEGFERKTCSNCRKNFWTVVDGKTCGDPACSGGFRFVGNSPAKEKLSYIDVWKKFSNHFKKKGYEPIKRYPVAARWREDTDFVQASIYNFQPYVVSGETQPPANPLVVPQFCLRFNDIDNVGITGAHYTGFVMIGQHAFVPGNEWDQDSYFRDVHSWLDQGLGLPNEEITYHEDAWAGGGNFGPCMEYFSRGLELGNQVYMLYEIHGNSYKELPLKVLDMGMGQERNAWFTGAAPTSYETTFPTVVKDLQERTGVKIEKELMQKFLPYSSYLNVDETADIEKTWDLVASKVGLGTPELKKKVLPLAALYSVAEHAQSLLIAISDGILPSNVKGGYNLRVILRRALSFIENYGWDVELPKVAEIHAQYLKPQYPELRDRLKEVTEILEVEKRKFNDSNERANQLIKRMVLKNESLTSEKLVELYDSKGITPFQISQRAHVEIPENFYALVAERHEKKEQKASSQKGRKIDVGDVPATEVLYYHDYEKTDFKAKVLKITGNDVILDRTCFFPTSGGQVNDLGFMNGQRIINVFRQGKHVIHQAEKKPEFEEGDEVSCKIDFERRKQLSQHHTLTHVFNQLIRRHLGKHASQAGTAKFVEKARLDMTHYQLLDHDQVKSLEKEANHIIEKGLEVISKFVPRTEAEQEYGFGIYQGPVVPGKNLRIVEIEGFDVEACGGTHVKNTKEIEGARIIKSSKVQDGVVRIEYVGGSALQKASSESEASIQELSDLLECSPGQIPGRVEELFKKWKQKVKKGKKVDVALTSVSAYEGDVSKKASEILRTPPEHLVKTAKRFLKELRS